MIVYKSISCCHYRIGHRVCKIFFAKTLDISIKRIDNIVLIEKKINLYKRTFIQDQRGKKVPHNKIEFKS